MERPRPPADLILRRSARDTTKLPARLAAWLAPVLHDGAGDVGVTLLAGTDANGMSSETLSVEASWTERGRRRSGRYVARVVPADEDVPVFPEYSLGDQYETMRLVAELTDVPVPRVRWLEPTGEVIGSPFFLMDHVDGVVPQDVLPYNFGDNWLYDAAPEDQRRLQDRTGEAIARLHAVPDAGSVFGFLAPRHGAAGDPPLARHLAYVRDWYRFAVAGLGRSPLVERGLAWLGANLPETREPVLCWGDARIGTILYRGFTPAAELDWEMATLGPRELDVSWLVFAHRVFESITSARALPGRPGRLREEDVRAGYERAAGTAPGDLRWYHVFNAVRWAVIFMRTGTRQIRFGEIDRPADIETVLHHGPLLVEVLNEVGA